MVALAEQQKKVECWRKTLHHSGMTKEEIREYNRQYRIKHAERLKAYKSTPEYRVKRSASRRAKWKAMSPMEKLAASRRRRERRSPAAARRDVERRKEWKERNRDYLRATRSTPEFLARKREQENRRCQKPEVKKRIAERCRERRANDLDYSLLCRLRGRLKNAIHSVRATKSARTVELLGCDIPFLRQYIESRFLPGMTWENRNLWQIDHRIPCAKFNLKDSEEQKRCFHYSNLQPMWRTDNMRKKAKMPGTHQAELI